MLKQFASTFFNIITVAHLRIDFPQLSIILMSYVFIVNSRQAHRVVVQVTGMFCGGSAVGKKTAAGGNEQIAAWDYEVQK